MDRKHNDVNNVDTLISAANNLQLNSGNKTREIYSKKTEEPVVLFIEPFYGGSHKQLLDELMNRIPHTFIGLSAKKWPWRARCSALILSELIPPLTTEKTLFCSSVLSLSEVLGLRPDLNVLKKVVYFHENQLVYPIRQVKDRDVQFAYNQITTCLSADEIIFNSNFNKDSFLENINKIIKMLPDYRPKNLREKILPKCRVLYFPISFKTLNSDVKYGEELAIVWPHRWEFDKDPETMINALLQLKKNGYKFKVHILGEAFQDVPDIFTRAKNELSEEILTFGHVESKESYFDVLKSSHVVVSTAKHEFFGVSMLEATFCGCFPLVPNRLVYPEIYPKQCLYGDDEELVKRLCVYSSCPQKAIEDRSGLKMDFRKYSAEVLLKQYIDVFK